MKTNEFTKIKELGKDELWCEFWECEACGNSNIPAGSNYCSDCGREIIKPIKQQNLLKRKKNDKITL